MLDFLAIPLEIFVLFLISIIAMRIMGKTTIAQVTPYDLVVIFLFGTIAAESLLSSSFIVNIYSLVILVLTYLLFARLTLKQKVNEFLLGKPTIVIKHGRIIEENLRKNNLPILQLLSLLRINGYPRLEDVEYGILEPVGTLSIVPKCSIRALTPRDLGMEVAYEGLPMSVIIDGRVQSENLSMIGKGRKWLEEMLKKEGIEAIDDVTLAYMSDSGSYYIDLRNMEFRRGRVDDEGERDIGGKDENLVTREDVVIAEKGVMKIEGLQRSGLEFKEIQRLLKERGWGDLNQVDKISVEVCRRINIHGKMGDKYN
ncbi:MAG: DUF421 domain-containing protein [Clostridia bacterium]|nr:DUF421 domain-containing protein [Clostridia bacterium]